MRIKARELRQGMTVIDPENKLAKGVKLGDPFLTVGKYDVAFRAAGSPNHIMVWPSNGVAHISGLDVTKWLLGTGGGKRRLAA